MGRVRRNPHIYEINLMTWLNELSQREQRRIALKEIPDYEWLNFKEKGLDLIWLMGIWKRSPHSKRKAREEPHLVEECRSILENFGRDDIVGSPYAVYEYLPDQIFGSAEDLLSLKNRLDEIGLFLILDFVPNHTSCDHPWIREYPERYVQGEPNPAGKCNEGFFLAEDTPGRPCIAHGKDPYFPPWTDTAQINYKNVGTLKAMREILSDISRYCRGFRCDMAMLVIRDIFNKTWDSYLDNGLCTEDFWPMTIDGLRADGKPCLWIAEAYWGLEQELLNFGFDYVYDKTFYNILFKEDVQGLKAYLSSPVVLQEKMVRFLENHDEPRALQVFGSKKIRCAMVIHATLPGMRFWQHGQLEGSRIRTPVQLRRSPAEPTQNDLRGFFHKLLREINEPVFHNGDWELCQTSGWPDNQSHLNLLAWCWRRLEERRLVVINFSSSPAQGYVKFSGNWLPKVQHLFFRDPLKDESFLRSEKDFRNLGMYVGLEEMDFHFFRIEKG